MGYQLIKKAVTALLTSAVIVFICVLVELAAKHALWAVLILWILILFEQKEGEKDDV